MSLHTVNIAETDGSYIADFVDRRYDLCELAVTSKGHLAVRMRGQEMHLDRRQARDVAAVLARFAECGTLAPPAN